MAGDPALKIIVHAAYPLWRKNTLVTFARARELADQGHDVRLTHCAADGGTCACKRTRIIPSVPMTLTWTGSWVPSGLMKTVSCTAGVTRMAPSISMDPTVPSAISASRTGVRRWTAPGPFTMSR